MTVELSRQRDSEAMVGSLQALLTGVIDYAGLFPPAKLDMASTVRHYAEALAGPDAWMLGRLAVPAARLDEFDEHVKDLLPGEDGDEPWRLTCMVAPADDPQLEADLRRIDAFNAIHADAGHGLASIRLIEMRAMTADAIEEALELVPDELFPLFELPVDRDTRGLVAALAGSDAGGKVRTGGLEAKAIPTPEHLARFIAACAAADVPFKATAGLHHPFRHFQEAVGAMEFGFLNVLLAGVFADKINMSEPDLRTLLVEGAADAFAFHDEELRYGDRRLSTEAVADAREKFSIALGSCSFAEPLEHLRAIKLL
jgi:hypothetical protein